MIQQIQNPQLKIISFESYKKWFSEALRNPQTGSENILFFKINEDESMTVSFSFQEFIVMFNVTMSQLTKEFDDDLMNDYDVAMSDRKGNKYHKKFNEEWLFGRGIPEE